MDEVDPTSTGNRFKPTVATPTKKVTAPKNNILKSRTTAVSNRFLILLQQVEQNPHSLELLNLFYLT